MTRPATGNREWWILATMTGAMSVVLIDETAVGVGLPTIVRHLHMPPSGLPWVVNSYLLALASCVAVGGRLGELLGQARMFRLGAVPAGCSPRGSPGGHFRGGHGGTAVEGSSAVFTVAVAHDGQDRQGGIGHVGAAHALQLEAGQRYRRAARAAAGG
jgi:MFS family permease